MNLETKIKDILDKKQKTIKWLTSEIEMSEQNIYKIFKRNSIETSHLIKIAEVLEVPVAYFFEEGNEPSCAVKKTDLQTSRIEQLMIENSALKDEIIKLYKKLTP